VPWRDYKVSGNRIEGIEEKAVAASMTVQLDEAALDRLAEQTRRSRDWHVGQAIEEYVAITMWQLKRVEAGIEAAEQGDFASDDEGARVRAKIRT
jgi:predicted transcriptional regulator